MGTRFSDNWIKYCNFHSRKCIWKCRLRYGGHLALALILGTASVHFVILKHKHNYCQFAKGIFYSFLRTEIFNFSLRFCWNVHVFPMMQWCNWQYIRTGLSNGFAKNRQKAFTWTNADQVLMASLRHSVNSSPPIAAYMRQWTGSSLLQVMACRLIGAKPLPAPMLTYCQLDSWEHDSVKFES